MESRGVGRVAAEFVIILLGVLGAFSVEELREGRGERARERIYLAQLISDLEGNVIRLAEATELEERHAQVARALAEAAWATTATSSDSVGTWLARRDGSWWSSDPRLLRGTLTALTATGDITLLREPSVRSAVLAYASQLEDDLDYFRFYAQVGTVNRLREAAAPYFENVSPDEPIEVRLHLAALASPQGRAALQELAGDYESRLWYLDQIRLATDSLLAVLR